MEVNNIKIKTKITILTYLLLSVSFLMVFLFIYNLNVTKKSNLKLLEETVLADYDSNIKNQVENVISLLNSVYAKYENGEYTLEESKKVAADLVRDLRYGVEGYFWIDTYEGDNVVLLGGDKEGTNRMSTTDVNGYAMVKDIIAFGRNEGGGYTDYWFPKEGESEASPKRSYSLAFEPFEWVVGTGNYIDSITEVVDTYKEKENEKYKKSVISYSLIFLIAFAVSVTVTTIISKNLNKSFATISKFLNTLATGDFSSKLPKNYYSRKDDFGQLAHNLESMRESISNLVGNTKIESDNIVKIVNNVNENIGELYNNIEDVSATTEELAAGMEETAASAEEMSATSSSIESAAQMIATKSKEGALRVVEINKHAKQMSADVKEVQDKTTNIRMEIEEKLQKALEQSKVVSQIDVLSDAIMNVTSQTNLLALNAAIEAARAGEAGKGFSVVAEEIRNLAEQSKETVEQIQMVTAKVTEAVSNLSENASVLLDFVSTDVSKNFQSFRSIMEIYSEDAEFVDQLITDFDAASQELSTSIQEVIKAVNEVAKSASEGALGTTDIAQKIASITEQSSAVASQIEQSSNSSDKLNQEISKFKMESI